MLLVSTFIGILRSRRSRASCQPFWEFELKTIHEEFISSSTTSVAVIQQTLVRSGIEDSLQIVLVRHLIGVLTIADTSVRAFRYFAASHLITFADHSGIFLREIEIQKLKIWLGTSSRAPENGSWFANFLKR